MRMLTQPKKPTNLQFVGSSHTLQKTGEVIVAKSNAECFLATCGLVNVKVDYKLSNGKVLFTLK